MQPIKNMGSSDNQVNGQVFDYVGRKKNNLCKEEDKNSVNNGSVSNAVKDCGENYSYSHVLSRRKIF